MIRHKHLPLIIVISTLTLSACGGGTPVPSAEPPPPTPTAAPGADAPPTPDPCAPENLPTQVEPVHRLMREFDDASQLALNTPLEQLNPSIAELQRIRREAQDQFIPACLVDLKGHQLAHMNTVINTMLGFLSGANVDVLNEGIELARQQHDEYTLELAGLLGLTVVTHPTVEIVDGTPVATPTATAVVLFVSNPGPTAVNIRTQPDLEAETLGVLDVGLSAVVLGRTNDALWYQIKLPGYPDQSAWVFASLVAISDPSVELPILDIPQ